jgi:hypothetical protein
MTGKRFRFRISPVKMIGFLLLGALALLGLGALVMYLWNAILPDLLHVGEISLIKAIGLLLLCRLLFGSFRPRGGSPRRWGRPDMEGRFMHMTDEEKAELKEQWRKRCDRRNR